MPHVVVYNLMTTDFTEERIAAIETCLLGPFLAIPELGLTRDDVSFSFLSDPSVKSDIIPIVIVVELLFEKPERTKQVRSELAAMIGRNLILVVDWRRVTDIEVAIKRFNPEKDGFWFFRHRPGT